LGGSLALLATYLNRSLRSIDEDCAEDGNSQMARKNEWNEKDFGGDRLRLWSQLQSEF
jgi:hypothetical protein